MNAVFTRPEHGCTSTTLPSTSKANGEVARDRAVGPTTMILLASHLEQDHTDLRRLFESARWQTHGAYCCREGVAAIAEDDPDTVVCEASLPDGSWKDLLKALSRGVNPPYLIVTSHLADQHLWAEVLNLGGHDVLAKPFDAEEVRRVVGLACEHHQERQIRRAAAGNATAIGKVHQKRGTAPFL